MSMSAIGQRNWRNCSATLTVFERRGRRLELHEISMVVQKAAWVWEEACQEAEADMVALAAKKQMAVMEASAGACMATEAGSGAILEGFRTRTAVETDLKSMTSTMRALSPHQTIGKQTQHQPRPVLNVRPRRQILQNQRSLR